MPVLNTKEELVAALQNSIFSADPMADLAQKGYTLGPVLKKEWEAVRAGKKLPRKLSVNPDTVKGTFAFKLGRAPLTAPNIPSPGSYDLTAGLTIGAANEALGAVYNSGTIPHRVALDQLLSPGELAGLASFFVVDKPGGEISRLHIRSAPTLAATTDGSKVVAVEIPIQIDWDRTVEFAGRQFQKLVTDATGTLQVTMRLNAPVAGSNMTIGVQAVSPSSAAESPRLTLDANSPVQLANPTPLDQIDQLALAIQVALAIEFQNDLSFTVSPAFTLPIGTLTVQQLDVVATGGALVAGVKAVTGGTGNTSTLANLLPDSTSNIFLQLRDIVPNALLQIEVNNGDLTRQAQASQNNAVVESAAASFQNNAIVVNVQGKLVHACGFDVGFWATHTASFQFQGSSIEIDQKDDHGVDTGDAVLCVLAILATLGLIALAAGILLVGIAAAFEILGDVLFYVGIIALVELLNGGPNGTQATIVDLNLPIPGSDVLPTLSGGDFQVANGVMLIAATAGTQPDNVNKHIYVRFLIPRPGSAEVGDNVPLVGVKVVMMNQDVPPPPGGKHRGRDHHELRRRLSAPHHLHLGNTGAGYVARSVFLGDEGGRERGGQPPIRRWFSVEPDGLSGGEPVESSDDYIRHNGRWESVGGLVEIAKLDGRPESLHADGAGSRTRDPEGRAERTCDRPHRDVRKGLGTACEEASSD